MAKTHVLFIADCIGADSFYHKKGTVMAFDDEKKSDVPTLAALKAAGRIVPATKENLNRCAVELAKRKDKDGKVIPVVLTDDEENAGIGAIADALAMLADQAKGPAK